MVYQEALSICNLSLLPMIRNLYNIASYTITPINSHIGGRNLAYTCIKEGQPSYILRISFLADRHKGDLLGEVEYIRYLFDHGASVSNVKESIHNNLLEDLTINGHHFYICLFDMAPGKLFADNNYKYRDGAPITEYFYNCGKVLGKIHALSKNYKPNYPRYDFFDKYNITYIEELIPNSLPLLKEKLIQLLHRLEELYRTDHTIDSYGMVHFDYSDGNYMIDFQTGQITVFDFDNSCYCWYLYDLANLWIHGVGFIQFETDRNKRKEFMDEYFSTILKGYQSETSIDPVMLDQLPLLIQVVLLENITDEFETMKHNNEEIDWDEEFTYLIRCIEEDIPYAGFFSDLNVSQ